MSIVGPYACRHRARQFLDMDDQGELAEPATGPSASSDVVARKVDGDPPWALEQHVPAARDEPSRPAYDAVDLAWMMARSTGARRSHKSSRYAALIMVVLLFMVLLGIGIWLVTQVHSLDSNPRNSVITPVSIGAYASVSEALPLPLWSCK
jgi:hypothetical protein